MSWMSDYKYKWYEKVAMRIIRSGGFIPRHIAFVMDGNRRFAQSEHLKKIDGHSRGFDKLADCLRWCLDTGIQEVTTFAFSIENFKRSEEEVRDLLNLAREKFERLLDELPQLHEHGVCIRIIGNMSLLPAELQQLIARAVLSTENNNKLFLNIAFAYTSHDEIAQAIEVILEHGKDILQKDDINESLVESCLYTANSPPPDLLFRTSGETRISDFLMLQLRGTILYFSNVLWPQVTLWNFLAGIFAYQRAKWKMDAESQHLKPLESSQHRSLEAAAFLQKLHLHRRSCLQQIAAQ